MNKVSKDSSRGPQIACNACPVRPVAFYAVIPPEQMGWLNSHRLGFREVRARRTILREGDIPDEVYTIFSGWACRYKQLPDGRRQIFSFLLPGDMVVPQALFPEPLRFSLKAITDTLLCRFRVADMREFIAAHESLRDETQARCFHHSAMLDDRLIDLGRRNAEERILQLLLEIHGRQAQRHAIDLNGSYEFPLRQEDIADALGLTTVHVSRTLAALKKKGLVILQLGRLTLPDLDAAHAAIERI